MSAPEPLDDLSSPFDDGHARDHWDRHAPYLAENGLLNSATADSFALCCDLWELTQRLRHSENVKQYLDAGKSYLQWAKFFRLVPLDKPGRTPASRYEAKKEFDFDGFNGNPRCD